MRPDASRAAARAWVGRMLTVTVWQAKVVITRRGKPVTRLVGIRPLERERAM